MSSRSSWGLDTGATWGPDWAERAACRHHDPSLWFPDREDTKRDAYRQARKICHTCPVLLVCREYALYEGEKHGMWGGLTPRQLHILRARLAEQGIDLGDRAQVRRAVRSIRVVRRRRRGASA